MIIPDLMQRTSSIEITSVTETDITSYGFVDNVYNVGSPQRWKLVIVTPLGDPRKLRELNAFVNSLGGRRNVFSFKCPLPFYSSVDTFTVKSTLVSGDTVLVGNLPPNREGALVAGDFIIFGNHTKVYQISNTSPSDGNGNSLMSIFPSLTKAVEEGVSISSGVFTLRCEKDINTLKLNGSGKQRFTLTALESF